MPKSIAGCIVEPSIRRFIVSAYPPRRAEESKIIVDDDGANIFSDKNLCATALAAWRVCPPRIGALVVPVDAAIRRDPDIFIRRVDIVNAYIRKPRRIIVREFPRLPG